MTSRPDSPASTSTHNDSDEAREALRQRARDAIARQPARTVTVLSSLLAVHEELGHLCAEAIEEVAAKTSHSPNEVWGVASFYPNFRFTPPNRHVVELCWGPTCHVLGAQPILQRLLAHLELANEGDTTDGVISFKLNTCLGVCAHGPAMNLDEELAGHMTADKAVRLVERIKADDEEEQKALAVARESEASRRELRKKTEAIAKERAMRVEAEAKAKSEEEAKAWERYIEEAKAKVAAEEQAKAEAAVAAHAEANTVADTREDSTAESEAEAPPAEAEQTTSDETAAESEESTDEVSADEGTSKAADEAKDDDAEKKDD